MKKTAAEEPGEKWIAMWKTWTMKCDWMRRGSYCDPDNFGMYIHNDFFGYGIQELVENMVSSIYWIAVTQHILTLSH